MGNIRTSFVKRLAKELIETHKGVFTTDFDQNKKLVMEYSTVSTKHLRNKMPVINRFNPGIRIIPKDLSSIQSELFKSANDAKINNALIITLTT